MSFQTAARPLCVAAAIAALALAGALPGRAQVTPGAASPNPMIPDTVSAVALTDDKVEGFIASYPAVTAKMDEIETKYDLPNTKTATPAEAWQAMATFREISGELDDLVDDYGFASYGEWVQVAMAVAMSHAFVRKGGNLDSQMAETIARVEKDPNIPAAQKEMILQQLQTQSQMMSGMRPSQENVAVVGRFGKRLDKLFASN